MTGILLIATGRYQQFIGQMLESLKKHWKQQYKVFLFSDMEECEGVELIKTPTMYFPFPTLYRYKWFNQQKERLSKMDYLFYIDIDCKLVGDITNSILKKRVNVRHCGYYFRTDFPHEPNPLSVFYPYMFTKYYGGGFQGGEAYTFLEMSYWCEQMIDKDLQNGVMPVWHDETAMNCYLTFNPPTLELDPDYHYPENTAYFSKRCWNGTNPFRPPKIMLLKKDHEKIRL